MTPMYPNYTTPSTRRPVAWLLAASLLAALPAGARAQASDEKLRRLETTLAELQAAEQENRRRQEILTEEVRKLREERELPETPELVSQWGLGPAASKVYGVDKGISFGGYGQAWHTSLVNDAGAAGDTFDFKRLILYSGYKFNDKLVFNSELEFEHANSVGGEVAVEFATLDFLMRPELNFRAGLVLMPIGFINEMHEPLFYRGNERPEIERAIIPTTWRENGAGIFGRIGDDTDYRAYLVTSMRGSRFSSANLRGGRQQGSQSLSNDYSLALRVDHQATPELSLGGSLYTGDQGQDEALVIDAAGTTARPDVETTLYELHAQYRSGGWQLRGLYTHAEVGDADLLSAARALAGAGPVGSVLEGGYLEAAYDIMPHINERSTQYLGLFLRRESFDTLAELPAGFADDLARDVELTTVGLDYHPDPQVAVKLDYRNFSLGRGTRPDEINLGIGWIF